MPIIEPKSTVLLNFEIGKDINWWRDWEVTIAFVVISAIHINLNMIAIDLLETGISQYFKAFAVIVILVGFVEDLALQFTDH